MEIIAIYSSYKPNIAGVNRLLSFLHGCDELGVNVEMVFVYSNENGDRILSDSFKHVRFTYLWENHKCRNKYLKFIRSFYDVKKFVKGLQVGANVILMSSSEYLPFITWRSDINVYHERTEHPYVAKTFPSFLQKSYFRACVKTKGLFVISTPLRDFFNTMGVKKISIVNMTVDVNRFEGIIKHSVKDHYIAYCGSASNNKDGVDILIRSFAIVHEQFPWLKLYIIGNAPKANDDANNLQLVADLGIQDAVIYKGVIPTERIPQILKDADLLSLARPDSLQAKCGFPTKLGEYLLSGNPVVVTGVGDIPLFMKDGYNALVAEPGNVEDFAKKMIWVFNHPQEACTLGRCGKETALKCFNYYTEAKKIIDVMLNNLD